MHGAAIKHVEGQSGRDGKRITDLSDLKYLIACEACEHGRIDNASFTKWRKTLDSMGKSFPISRMSEFPKILPQPDCSVMAPALSSKMIFRLSERSLTPTPLEVG
jgi:hypothetical protein